MKIITVIIFLLFINLLYTEESINLAGNYLSMAAFEGVKSGKTVKDLKKQLQKSSDQQQKLCLQKKIETYEIMQKFLPWHYTIATTGLIFTMPEYPYLPHFFSLWELAPKKGAGITIALLDTGVAAFEVDGQPYKKHPDLTIPENIIGDFLNESNRSGFEALLQHVHHYLPKDLIPEVNLEQEVITWINDYCINKNIHSITNFFNTIKIPENKTYQIINEITYGRRGIMPYATTRFFTPVQLTEPVHKKVIFEFLPIPVMNKTYYAQANHGTHIYGLINAKSIGLAPCAQCIMIKICKEDGITDKETLIGALKKAHQYNPDIINVSLKIDDIFSDSFLNELQQLLDSFPYVVAASGNGKQTSLAYPARCKNIAFDVGSFSYDSSHRYPISSFSQYEPGIGPKFVAPGFNILSTGYLYSNNQQEMGYLFLSGTSMASALMTGFVALMLSEFKEDFTREQLLTVCYGSTLKMHNTNDWNKKCTLGVLDMRTALFILHICRAFKEELMRKKTNFDCEKDFNNLVEVIRLILFEMPRNYAKHCSNKYDFVHSFADFCKTIPKSKNSFYKKKSLETITSEFLGLLFAILNKNSKQARCSFITVSDCLFAKLYDILLNSKKNR